jgi:hypothetical protein
MNHRLLSQYCQTVEYAASLLNGGDANEDRLIETRIYMEQMISEMTPEERSVAADAVQSLALRARGLLN